MAYIGWESGGTKLVVTLSLDGRFSHKSITRKRPSANTARESLASLIQMTQSLLKEASIGPEDIECIGFGFGGNIDSIRNVPLLCLHESGWKGFPVTERVEAELGLPVLLVNDCDAAGLAEAAVGQSGSFRSLFYVTLGTGVGGSLVVDGQLFRTSPLGNAEIGHLRVDELETPCPCGSGGCVEAVCSGPGLMRLAKNMSAGTDPGHWKRPEEVTKAYLNGDPFASVVMAHFAKCLARGLASVITLLTPDRVVLGGGLGTFVVQHLLDAVKDECNRLTYPPFRQNAQITEWALKEGAVSLGAIHHAAQSAPDGKVVEDWD